MIHRPIAPRRLIRTGRKDCWYVKVPMDLQSSKDSRTRYFADKKTAILFAKSLSDARNTHGAAFLKLPPPEQSELLRLLHDHGIDWLISACRERAVRNPESELAFSVVSKQYLSAKDEAGKFAPVTYQSIKSHFKAFSAFIGTKPFFKIDSSDIDRFIKTANLQDGTETSQRTKLGRLRALSGLWNWAVRKEIVTKNPTVAVESPENPFTGIGRLSVKDCAKLLETCQEHNPRLLYGYIGLVLFGGFRPKEAARCVPSDFVIDSNNKDEPFGRIVLGGERSKLGKARNVPVNPTLAAFFKSECLGIKRPAEKLRAVKKIANVVVGHNYLRHTFCTMAVPIFGAEMTAKMANNSTAMLNDHYASCKVTADEAKEFWALRPKILGDYPLETLKRENTDKINKPRFMRLQFCDSPK